MQTGEKTRHELLELIVSLPCHHQSLLYSSCVITFGELQRKKDWQWNNGTKSKNSKILTGAVSDFLRDLGRIRKERKAHVCAIFCIFGEAQTGNSALQSGQLH